MRGNSGESQGRGQTGNNDSLSYLPAYLHMTGAREGPGIIPTLKGTLPAPSDLCNSFPYKGKIFLGFFV